MQQPIYNQIEMLTVTVKHAAFIAKVDRSILREPIELKILFCNALRFVVSRIIQPRYEQNETYNQ